MTAIISSRTPEGRPNRCPVCKATVYLETSEPLGDAPCPACGHLLFYVVSGQIGRLYAASSLTPELREALANSHGTEQVVLSQMKISAHVIQMVAASMAQTYQIVPVDFYDGVLTIALGDPMNVNAIDDLRFMLNCEVEAVISNEQDVQAAIRRYYGDELEGLRKKPS
jgi:hypothetical protein